MNHARRRFLVTLFALTVLAAVMPAAVMPAAAAAVPVAAADGDITPPVPAAGQRGVEWWDYDKIHQLIDVRLTFVDPESGVASVLISCDGGPEASYPYAGHVFIPAIDPAAGGCAGYGQRALQARAVNGDGAISPGYTTAVTVFATFALEFPVAAQTGQPFTVHVHYSAGFTPPPDDVCIWEVRWGDVASLRDNEFDETFGGMLFQGTPGQGYCNDWTFTLPWVPEPRFEFNLSMQNASDIRSTAWPDRNLVMAKVVGTDRRIRQSSLPIAQVLPSTYAPIVGQPITYTRYLIGGAATCCKARWSATLGSGETPLFWEKITTSATFTITPPKPGAMVVGWDRFNAGGAHLSAYYDPPVRRRDTTRPNTSPPIEHVGGAVLGPTVPVTITWGGTDRGWGIASYKLQQRVNGGTWTTIKLPTARARSIVRLVKPGVTVRYRVRAIDKAGNVGFWDYGPTFKPRVAAEASTAIHYTGQWISREDPTAQGGHLRESSTAGARATLAFSGRDLGWFGERGPGHGKARVYVDGVLAGTVDLNATVAAPRRLVFRRHWSTVGHHTVRIVVSGARVVDVDAFAVMR